MPGKLTAQLNGLFYGWRMVAAGCAMRMLGGGFHLYGFTIFFLPITNELGLSRAATSLVFSLARAEGAIEGPLAGYFIDRYGPRPMMLAGIILSGLGYMLLATVESYAAFLAVYLGVISLAFSAGFMHSPMVLANSWFIRRRAMAMTLDQQRHRYRRHADHADPRLHRRSMGLALRCVYRRHWPDRHRRSGRALRQALAGKYGTRTRRRAG